MAKMTENKMERVAAKAILRTPAGETLVDFGQEITGYVEFTVEANPGTIDEEKLASFVSLGVNRLSIGLQTIHENRYKANKLIYLHMGNNPGSYLHIP